MMDSEGKRSNDFYQDVFDLVRLIPKGKVTSYGAIARYLGSASASRMVGWAMNASHKQLPPVPAHRVVNRNGMLSGKMHFPSPDAMQSLLEAEGVKVVDDQIVNFQQHFWNPIDELGFDD